MSIEASLPRLLAIFGVSCSVVLAGRTDSMIMLATASALVAITVATSI